ncbi:hypothetical protein ACFVYA_36235 [Amycolatopsis sp. NPDC058278]|uniref:hypothetical protein n=1 Tax=Amycolatopsis sp. NPDC058278 TaxID=3346417 RepID=UPI0036D91061
MTTARAGRRTAVVSPVATGLTVAVLALNLRPTVTSIGALLARIEAGADVSPALAATLVALPTWCFAVGGWTAWRIRARFGIRAVVSSALAALTRLAGRPDPARRRRGPRRHHRGVPRDRGPRRTAAGHRPRRDPGYAACYTTCLGAGSAVGALLTPTGVAWQRGLGCWAILAAAALLIGPWTIRTGSVLRRLHMPICLRLPRLTAPWWSSSPIQTHAAYP